MKAPLTLAVLLLLIGGSSPSRAAILDYVVTVDTGALTQGQTFGFEGTLVDDNGIGNDNTVNLNTFDFNSGPATSPGAASGTPTLSGGASGSVASGFTFLQNQGNVAQQSNVRQGFTTGDLLTFNLRLNTGAGTSPSPDGTDRFSFYLFNSAGTRLTTVNDNGQSQSGQLNPLFTIDFFAPSSPGITQFRANGSTSNSFVTVDVTPVPEPATMALMLCGLSGLAFHRRRKAIA